MNTLDVLRQGIAQGLHPGAQIYVSRAGQVICDDAVGESRPGVTMSTDTINLWMSCVKPVAAVAVGQLKDRELLNWDDPVARHVREFARHGKDAITIRHLLTHTAGIRALPAFSPDAPWDTIIDAICDLRIEPRWIPGEKAGYHHSSSWFMLAEIVRRLDGRTYDRYVREQIFLPLGMNDSWVGMPPDAYRKYGQRIGGMFDTSRKPVDFDGGIPTEAQCAAVRPAGNGRGPIRELATLYESLLRA
ncbi:MAG: serine hydrolase domain-containing protein, partial [Tepidisphaeraceae bacterium]